MRYFIIVFVSLLLFFANSCKISREGNNITEKSNSSIQHNSNNVVSLISPLNKVYVDPNQELIVELKKDIDSVFIDSVVVVLSGEELLHLYDNHLKGAADLRSFNPGTKRLLVKCYYNGTHENHSATIRLVSDIVPAKYSFKIIKTYPHDKGAYTQGLEYYQGFLYEGTGNYGESSLRKLKIENGEILKYRNLPSEIFGEGITRIDGKIYQITYKSQVGFVYDENTFELRRKIFYQNKEGWGLCNNGSEILMSDGSHIIYFMDTEYFSVIRKIEVFDDEKEVNLLNELELIDGILYANRYTTKEIVMIDPQTGKVLGKINMNGILDPKDQHPKIDYFNGIAYDSDNDRIFVTGKYWTKLYEVKFIKQQ